MPWLCLTELQDGNFKDYKTVSNINNNNINNKSSSDTLLVGGGITNIAQHPLSLTPAHFQQVNNNNTNNKKKSDDTTLDERDIIIQSINSVFAGDTDGPSRKRCKVDTHSNNIQSS
jgi:hypothetical protein